MTPDLICALDADLGLPVTTEQMRYGMTVEFSALPADPQWHTPAGLELAGPKYFGYEHEFKSFAKMGVLGEKSARVRLERFIGGGVREDLEPFVADIIQAFAPELQHAHFHREPEYPSD